MKQYKLLFADLDGTLIKTAAGDTFAQDVSDFRIRIDVLKAIKAMKGLKYLHVVTNQGGIPKYFTEKDFLAKFVSIMKFIQMYLNSEIGEEPGDDDIFVSGQYCASMDENNPRRKPNTGMLDFFLGEIGVRPDDIDAKHQMLMIGDASGKDGQYSDTDKRTAENFGIDYMDVEDFVKHIPIVNIGNKKMLNE